MEEEEARNLNSYSLHEACKQEEPDQAWPPSQDWCNRNTTIWSDYKNPYTKNWKPKICFSALQLTLCNRQQIKITIPILRMGKCS